MERKYQIFISSTYNDLVEERDIVKEQILRHYHFPIGMEMFSAGDEKQWNVIQRTIDTSDIYILILGYRYGSISAETGKSYTEMEYDYAIAQGKPVLAYLLNDRVLELTEELLRKKRGGSFILNDRMQAAYIEFCNKYYDAYQERIQLFRKKVSNVLVEFFTRKSHFDDRTRILAKRDIGIDVQAGMIKKISTMTGGGWVRYDELFKEGDN